jgi:DNA polymerase-3 subunit gamma/tau
MSYQVLARKWRPQSFEALVGQEHVVRALTHALAHSRLHHAYLFTGTRGVGKTTIARILAKALNCERGLGPVPCGSCVTCREIEVGRFVDLLEVDAATNTRVEEMRQLLESSVYAPTRGRYKVYVIDEVHMLSNSAFNSMLKTLEEPPEHVKFILATTDPQKIPVTVLSRCLQFNLKQVPNAAIVARLAQVLDAEDVAHEIEGLRLIAEAAGGSMRDALSLLDQAIAHGNGSVIASDVGAMLGTVDSVLAEKILVAVLSGDSDTAGALIGELADKGVSFDSALAQMAKLLVQAECLRLFRTSAGIEELHHGPVRVLAQHLDPESVQLAYQILVHGRQDLRLAPDQQAGFMMTMLRLLTLVSGRLPHWRDANVNEREQSIGTASLTAAGASMSQSDEQRKFSVKAGHPWDWGEILPGLGLSGMARELAQHCEFEGVAGDDVRFKLSPVHRHLLVPAAHDRLQKALSAALNREVRAEIDVAQPRGETPAARGERVKKRLQDEAIQSMEGDVFVRKVVDLFDARIVDSSIRPLA